MLMPKKVIQLIKYILILLVLIIIAIVIDQDLNYERNISLAK